MKLIQIFKDDGQLNSDYTGTSSPLSIDLNGLGSGIYIISVSHTTLSEVEVCKIIKQ